MDQDNALQVAQPQQLLPVSAIRERVGAIQRIMSEGMTKDKDYGLIPGCGDKPTLLKPGSEKILFTFRLAPDPIIEDLSTSDCYRYRTTIKLYEIDNNKFLGAGVGEASTDEEKYAWRRAVCDEEYDDTPDTRRRIKYGSKWENGGRVSYKTKQVRTIPADQANTVLKMSKKRAQIDAVLTVTAASEVFTQDLEDMGDRGATTGTINENTEPSSVKITFGKYKGKTIGELMEIDKQYVGWLSKKATTESIKNAAEAALKTSKEDTNDQEYVDPDTKELEEIDIDDIPPIEMG